MEGPKIKVAGKVSKVTVNIAKEECTKGSKTLQALSEAFRTSIVQAIQIDDKFVTSNSIMCHVITDKRRLGSVARSKISFNYCDCDAVVKVARASIGFKTAAHCNVMRVTTGRSVCWLT